MLGVVLGAVAGLLACDCISAPSPCDAINPEVAIFVGKVVIDSGEIPGRGPARVEIEERLQNMPASLRQVDVWVGAGTDCYSRMSAGERYLVFARRTGDARVPYASGACSWTTNLRRDDPILSAVRNALADGKPRVFGKVARRNFGDRDDRTLAGSLVSAVSGRGQSQTKTDAQGRYELKDLEPGRYRLTVSQPGFAPDQRSVAVNNGTCPEVDLSLWPDGRVSGVVASVGGQPARGITVQAFRRNSPSAVRSAVTDDRGRYTLMPLPGGDYTIGINADPAVDSGLIPPMRKPARVEDGRLTDGIDFNLPPLRKPVKLKITVLDPSGQPFRFATVRMLNPEGTIRWTSSGLSANTAVFEVTAPEGEECIVVAKASDNLPHPRAYHYLEGEVRFRPSRQQPEVTVKMTGKRFAIP